MFWIESNGVYSEENVTIKRKDDDFFEKDVRKVKEIIVDNLSKIEEVLKDFDKRKEFRTEKSEIVE